MEFSDDMVDEIFDIFQAESEEIITRLNENLLALEKNNNDKDAILKIFRDAHSLKGAARMIGLNDIQTIAHKIEDVLGLAKEEKLFFNKEVIDILYSSIDFLADFIEKSIKKRKQVYSENFSKQMEILEKITDIAGLESEEKNKQEIQTDVISESPKTEEINNITESEESNTQEIQPQQINQTKIIKEIELNKTNQDLLLKNEKIINENIIKSLFIIMKMEQSISLDLIKSFYDVSTILREIFVDSEYYEIKENIENLVVKLDLTLRGSGTLTENEINDLHNNIDRLIEQISNFYEICNIPVEDYYGKVFEIEDEYSLFDKRDKEESDKKEEDIINLDNLEVVDEVSINSQKVVNEKDVQKLNSLIEYFEKLSNNNCSAEEVNKIILDDIEQISGDEITKILKQIQSFLEFSIKEEVRLTEDVFEAINEGLKYCLEIVENSLEDADISLILNRLSIVKQILEIDNVKTENKFPINSNKEKVKKIADVTEVFNTGEIKVLRVDSVKLDELRKQVNELTIEKIKTKNHLGIFNKIIKELNDNQKDLSKLLNFLKYNEKKISDTNKNNILFLNILRQLKNSLILYNKNFQKIETKTNVMYRKFQENDMKLNIITNNISNMVKNIRILPFGTVFHLFGRMVRDIAQEKGKKIIFEIFGSEVCADKKIIEEIKAPLIHIIRNSIDHGIETPEERKKEGKYEEGRITLSAYQTTNKVIIEIKDDGRGIDIEKIKEKAISKGFLTKEEISNMNDEQITSLIFAPGFSTGDKVTDISGRGIGLDVVQSKITQLNGKVKVLSEYKKGCCTQIILPTAMAIMKVFVVEIKNQFFAIPIDSVQTFLRKSTDEIIYRKNKKSIIYENEAVNLFNLSEILGLEAENTGDSKKHSILILENEEKRIAVGIDKLIGEQEIIHKKLSAPFYKLKNISGITTLVSGEICLILNVNDIIKNQNTYTSMPQKSIKENTNEKRKILLVDDSITTIMLEKNILTKSGYIVSMASNPVEAFKYLETDEYDLIITDFEMPEMDGITFLKKLKKNEKYSKIPTIMMSSIFSAEKRKTALSLGACEYISKLEFNQDDFQEIIKENINKNI